MPYTIAMIGAGSFFTDTITEGLCRSPEIFSGSTFRLMDTDPQAVRLSRDCNRKIVKESGADITITSTTNLRKALEGCDYVVTSFEKKRVPYWLKDIEIPQKFGVEQFMGENGGPGGQAHAMRNITLFMRLCKNMREVCPGAWIMNFTNPMSFLCTYLKRHGGIRSLGFCHQVHGSFGVVAEMLGMQPGELEVISGGVNHFNWLLDVRRRGSGESFMDEFVTRVKKSKWWKKNHPNIPQQMFTLDVLNTFGLYPVGYDDHICEYSPFFYDHTEWEKLGYETRETMLRRELRQKKGRPAGTSQSDLQAEQTRARGEYYNYPFPKDGHHPYYQEKPTAVMEAFATNTPLLPAGDQHREPWCHRQSALRCDRGHPRHRRRRRDARRACGSPTRLRGRALPAPDCHSRAARRSDRRRRPAESRAVHGARSLRAHDSAGATDYRRLPEVLSRGVAAVLVPNPSRIHQPVA